LVPADALERNDLPADQNIDGGGQWIDTIRFGIERTGR
jgi:hypothetical protein